ncbi:MAG: S8 family serine peptidase [Phycisphaerae bacterium]|nr:S8 family serine peptidase [Phycisphaerae bacterium]
MPRQRLSVAGRPVNLIESLEGRLFLAGDPWDLKTATGEPLGSPSKMEWRGVTMDVAAGSWVLSFSDRLGNQVAETTARAIAAELGVSADMAYGIGRGRWAALRTTGIVTQDAITRALGKFPVLTSIEPDRISHTARVPNDPQFVQQYTYQNVGQNIVGQDGVIDADIDATEAWDKTIGSQDVLIAIIDTGVQVDHPDLQANIWKNPGEISGNGIDDDGNGFVDDRNGWDFGELDNNPDDDQGHGTAVAGVVGAVGNNGIGVTGVAWNVGIVPLKIADRFGSLVLSAIIGSHDYATMLREQGFNLVASNNSYGGFASSFYADAPTGFDPEKDSIQRFIDSGGVFVAAAGNSAFDNDNPDVTAFPASYKLPGLVAVAATDNTDALASFSDWGAESVDLGAPGVFNYTTAMGSGYTFISGTSFSSPTVAGAVALLKSYKPNASPEEIRQALIDSADPLPALQGKVVSGGRLNVNRAIEIIGRDGPILRRVDPGPVTGQISSTTGTPVRSITVQFNKSINGSLLSTGGVSLVRNGADNIYGTGDDQIVPIGGVALSPTDDTTVVIALNLTSGFPQQRLPLDEYRLVLDADFFKDLNGNFLNGDPSSGTDATYQFKVVGVSGSNETNDTLATATLTTFGASGNASFAGMSLGDGIYVSKDIDLFRIDIPRGGQITGEVVAARLATTSNLDAVLRLFNARGEELAQNDQFFGKDPYIDYFVTTGGTYYLGVSGFGNSAYNPLVAASGTTQSIGAYTLKFAVDLIGNDQLIIDADIPVPLRIPASGSSGSTSSSVSVTDSRQVLDANVRVNLTHQYDSDLIMTLISPSGRSVVLVNRRGFNGQNFTNTLFDDDVATPISAGVAPFSGSFKPDQPLSTLDGYSALGTWTLVVTDAAGGNIGELISWQLQLTLANNIFGAFESNDTPETARSLDAALTSGSASINAFVGDGGFGQLDRDIFQFTVESGSTVTFQAFSQGAADLGLRLLNAAGTEITRASLAEARAALLQNFLIVDGGTYYIAVSENSNLDYDPFNVTTGVLAATTGNYDLDITIVAGVSDPALVTSGSVLGLGVNTGGTFLSGPSNPATGISYRGTEILFSSTDSDAAPTTYFGATANGTYFRNSYGFAGGSGSLAQVDMPMSIEEQSDAFNRRVVTEGLANGLRVKRSMSFGINDSFIVVDVRLTNTTANAMEDVQWMEAFNPNMGANLFPRTNNTANDLDPTRPFASAAFSNNIFTSGLTVALAAAAGESRATVNVLSDLTNLRDPEQLLALPRNDPNGATSDSLLSIGFDLGVLGGAGGVNNSTSFRYFIFVGDNPTVVSQMYDELNAGTGGGHLAADAADPADETLLQPDGSTNISIAQLPYRVYYPEGYANADTYTFIPMVNTNDDPSRVVVVARYEYNPSDPTAQRDQVIADFTLGAGQRGGITITDPGMYARNELLVRKDTPYSLEVRSQLPVAATFSHYDQFILAGTRAAVGEAFTTRVSGSWSFGGITKSDGSDGVTDLILFTNITNQAAKITTTLYPEGGGTPIVLTQELGAYRRGGWNFNAEPAVPAGRYGVRVVSDGADLIAAATHYDSNNRAAEGYAGDASGGATKGVLPEGSLGINSTSEYLQFLNTDTQEVSVTLSFVFSNGSAYRWVLTIPAQAQERLDIASLPSFPAGLNYAVSYEATGPITVSRSALGFGESVGTMLSDQAYSLWGFGEGFRPAVGSAVTESLKLYNPTAADVLTEITLFYDNGLGSETFRRVLPSRQVVDINVHDLVTGSRRLVDAFYGITVKSSSPIVASMTHADAFFPGSFATLGTPLGIDAGF